MKVVDLKGVYILCHVQGLVRYTLYEQIHEVRFQLHVKGLYQTDTKIKFTCHVLVHIHNTKYLRNSYSSFGYETYQQKTT